MVPERDWPMFIPAAVVVFFLVCIAVGQWLHKEDE